MIKATSKVRKVKSLRMRLYEEDTRFAHAFREGEAMEEVAENVKQAREQALMGNYDDAKVYYAGAIQAVHLLLKQIYEPDAKLKWREV